MFIVVSVFVISLCASLGLGLWARQLRKTTYVSSHYDTHLDHPTLNPTASQKKDFDHYLFAFPAAGACGMVALICGVILFAQYVIE